MPADFSDLDGNYALRRNNDRLCQHCVRADGRNDQVFCQRLDDRSASRHGISGGAGRRGNDDAVAGEARRLDIVAVDRNLHHARNRALGHDRVVERRLMQKPLPVRAGDGDVDHTARLDGIVARREPAQKLQLACLQLCNKAHRADVDAENRKIMRRGNLGGMQNRAVASEADEHVGVLDLAVQILKFDALRQLIVPVHVERQTRGGLHTAAFQNLSCLLDRAELLVPVGIRGQNNFHLDHPFSAACACATRSPGSG